MSEERLVEISEIRIEKAWMVRNNIDQNLVDEYAEQIDEIMAKSPIELFDTPDGLFLVDGLHRELAAQKRGNTGKSP